MKRSINFFDAGDAVEITGPTVHDLRLPPQHAEAGRHKGKRGKVAGHVAFGQQPDVVHVVSVPREPTADSPESKTENVEVPFSSLTEAT